MSDVTGLGLAAYGAYGATPQQQAMLMRRKMFPFSFLYSGQDQSAQDQSADQSDVPAYADGGSLPDAAGQSAAPQGLAALLADPQKRGPLAAPSDISEIGKAAPAPGDFAKGTTQGLSTALGMIGAAGGPLGSLAGYGLGQAIGSLAGFGQPDVKGMASKGISTGLSMTGALSALGPAGIVAGPVIGKAVGFMVDKLGLGAPQSTPMGLTQAALPGDLTTDGMMSGAAAGDYGATGMQAGPSGMSANAEEANPDSGNMGSGPGFARGGSVRRSDFMRGSGPVMSDTAGRADGVDAVVPTDSYIMPADVMATIGQGNNLAGAKRFGGVLRQAGTAPVGKPAPQRVRLSGGEMVIHPAHAAAIGGGNVKAGHAALDHIVQIARAKAARDAATLPPPK